MPSGQRIDGRSGGSDEASRACVSSEAAGAMSSTPATTRQDRRPTAMSTRAGETSRGLGRGGGVSRSANSASRVAFVEFARQWLLVRASHVAAQGAGDRSAPAALQPARDRRRLDRPSTSLHARRRRLLREPPRGRCCPVGRTRRSRPRRPASLHPRSRCNRVQSSCLRLR